MAGRSLKAARYSRATPSSGALGITGLVFGLIIIGCAIVIWLDSRKLPEQSEGVVGRHESAAKEGSGRGDAGVGETEDEAIAKEMPEEVLESTPAKEPLSPVGEESESAETNSALTKKELITDRAIELEEEALQEQKEYESAFSRGMALFDSGEDTKLIELFQATTSDLELMGGRKETLELWIQWADFLSAVEKSTSSLEQRADGTQSRKLKHIKIILNNGSEIEGGLVYEDSEKVAVKRGTITAKFLVADIKKRVVVSEAKPIEGRMRTLDEIADGIKALTLDEVLFLYRQGMALKSKAWVTSVLKKIPEDNPAFISTLFENIAEDKNRAFIAGLSFQVPYSHLLLAQRCKKNGLNAAFKNHRKRYLDLLGELFRKNSPEDHCIECQGAAETICKVCKGDGIEEVASVEFCEVCGGQGFNNCSVCSGWGEVTCSSCDGEGVRLVRKKRVIVVSALPRSRTSSSSTYGRSSSRGDGTVKVVCPKTKKCRKCHGRGKFKCTGCRRSKTKKTKETCSNCDDNGLAVCQKKWHRTVDAREAPGPIFTESLGVLIKEINSSDSRGNLTALQEDKRRSSLWNEHIGKWVLCIGEVDDVYDPNTSYRSSEKTVKISVTFFGEEKDFGYHSPYLLDAKNIQFAETIGKGDYIKAWIPIAKTPGHLDLSSAALIFRGPFKSFEEAVSNTEAEVEPAKGAELEKIINSINNKSSSATKPDKQVLEYWWQASKKLTAEQAAELLALKIGEWEISGWQHEQGKEPVEKKHVDTFRWREKGKSCEAFRVNASTGVRENFTYMQEYNPASGQFILRVYSDGRLTGTRRREYDRATRTYTDTIISPRLPANRRVVSKVINISDDKISMSSATYVDGHLVSSYKGVGKRKFTGSKPSATERNAVKE